ncbi:TIR domain-containing protein [Frankia sp. CNm7]|uniref:TIR domain-containing protein n=1 Tax=Frankia nepalensis TaxID=1836974 RepID=A0A937RDQ6_9ACTN|nr:SAV_2336 N-terminal domain-related protein [Frankia nepalensis]MBL7496191.1 TIR domain-containing protein [Frankia nepalensis]MBL7511601.1 TIR domain-containing protein [Frankia nepalensis]MBL7520629.1 TIR domain-containing protein [Frankia nepalensis]MBL7630276.1 TIR domain-containing protein [Frankia nepalensis]
MTTLAGLISGLRDLGADVDATALADALLLAVRRARAESGAETAGEVPGDSDDRPAGDQPETPPSSAVSEDAIDPAARTEIFDIAGGTGSRRASAVHVPRARSLPRAQEIARALRPLKRRHLRGRRAILDIDATIEAFAETDVLIPVMRPEPERWFDLDLVVDDSPTNRVWHELTTELLATFRDTGAFRSLRRWRLDVAKGILLDSAGRPAPAARLHEPESRRLVVLFSDCADPAWSADSTAWDLLHGWARGTPTVLLNPLPLRLWSRQSGFADVRRWVRLVNRAPGGPNTSLDAYPTGIAPLHQRPRLVLPAGTVLLPIAGLTPQALGAWAQMIAARRSDGLTGVLLAMPSIGAPAGPEAAAGGTADRPPIGADSVVESDLLDDDDTLDDEDDGWNDGWDDTTPSAADYVTEFRENASNAHVYRLAVLGSAQPVVSLSLMQLFRQEVVDGSEVSDLAEFVVSDLINAIPGNDDREILLRYRDEEVLRLLRRSLSTADMFARDRALTAFIARQAGRGATFTAAVPHQDGELSLPESVVAFARASRATLRGLGFAGPKPPVPPQPPVPPAQDPAADGLTEEEISVLARVHLGPAQDPAADRLTEEEIGELARVYSGRGSAETVLARAGLPSSDWPARFETPLRFWTIIARQLDANILSEGGRKILAAAAEDFPGNPVFHRTQRDPLADKIAGGGLTEEEIETLADVYGYKPAARRLLEAVGLPYGQNPIPSNSPVEFWREVARMLEFRAVPEGRRRLLAAASAQFPENRTLMAAAARAEAEAASGPRSEEEPSHAPERPSEEEPPSPDDQLTDWLAESEVRALTEYYYNLDSARRLLENAGLRYESLPVNTETPMQFWVAVNRMLTFGALVGARRRILEIATRSYPGARVFQSGLEAAVRAEAARAEATPPASARDQRDSAVHYTVLAVDMVAFAMLGVAAQRALQVGLREVIRKALDAVGGDAWIRGMDRGDGFFTMFPATVSKAYIVVEFVRELTIVLREYNETRTEQGRLRLRVAIHEGEVYTDSDGWGGDAVVIAMRLVDSDPVRAALAAEPTADLALILSPTIYDSVVRAGLRGTRPSDYREVEMHGKYRGLAWVTLPSIGAPHVPSAPGTTSTGQTTDQAPAAAPAAEQEADKPQGDDETGSPLRDDTRWDFVLSAAVGDEDWGAWIKYCLEEEDYRVRFPQVDVRVGESMVHAFDEAIRYSRWSIVVLSRASETSDSFGPGWSQAFRRDPNETTRTLIPVRVEDFQPQGLFATIMYIDLVGLDEREARATLIRQIRRSVVGGHRLPKLPPLPGGGRDKPTSPPSSLGRTGRLTDPPPFPDPRS